jgi:5-oxoprolinase (ATP-hydrolysing) subunit A
LNPSLSIDLNCDLGELDGSDGLQQDLALLRWVTSANVACGAHAGSFERMRVIAGACRNLGVAFGAHPGYVDREHFGRRPMSLPESALLALIEDQLRLAVDAASSAGLPVTHVKLHGALYSTAAVDPVSARCLISAVQTVVPAAHVVTLAGSPLVEWLQQARLPVIQEAFADRAVHSDGTLVPRSQAGAVLDDAHQIAQRAVAMIRDGVVPVFGGGQRPLTAQTLCIHGDHPHSVAVVRALRHALAAAGITVAPPQACGRPLPLRCPGGEGAAGRE